MSDPIGFLKEPVDVPARCADQHVRGSIRPIQPEQRQAGRVEKGTAGIEVMSPAVRALHFFPSYLVMLSIVTGIGALELFDEAHQSASQMIPFSLETYASRANSPTPTPKPIKAPFLRSSTLSILTL